jgi:hypothetical protein
VSDIQVWIDQTLILMTFAAGAWLLRRRTLGERVAVLALVLCWTLTDVAVWTRGWIMLVEQRIDRLEADKLEAIAERQALEARLGAVERQERAR